MTNSENSQPTPSFATFDSAFRRWRQGPWFKINEAVEERLTSYVPTTAARRRVRKYMGVDENEGYPAFVFTEQRSVNDPEAPLMSTVRIEITGVEGFNPTTIKSIDPRATILAEINAV